MLHFGTWYISHALYFTPVSLKKMIINGYPYFLKKSRNGFANLALAEKQLPKTFQFLTEDFKWLHSNVYEVSGGFGEYVRSKLTGCHIRSPGDRELAYRILRLSLNLVQLYNLHGSSTDHETLPGPSYKKGSTHINHAPHWSVQCRQCLSRTRQLKEVV